MLSADTRSGRPDSPELRSDLLRRARTIAMVGASPERWRPSFGIMRQLQAAGYRVIPVNPNHEGEVLHGEPVRASLAAADAALGGGAIDLVSVFRRSDALRGVVEDTIAAGIPAIWTQIGVRDDAAAVRAAAAGLDVVMDRCISVEHARLLG